MRSICIMYIIRVFRRCVYYYGIIMGVFYNNIHIIMYIIMEVRVFRCVRNYVIQQKFRIRPMKCYRGFYNLIYLNGYFTKLLQLEENFCDILYTFLYTTSLLQNMKSPSQSC